LTPTGVCDLSSTSSVKVRIRNAGTEAQTSIPVKYSINGGTPASETYAGNLAPGATAEYTFTTPANLSASGTYNIKAWTALSGDNILLNDSAKTSVTKAAVGNLLPVNFTGFGGGNLSALFTGWEEASGAAPSGTTSAWGSNTAIFGDAVASVNLYSTGKNEWIVSPIFVPSSASGLSFTAAIRDFSPTTDSSAMGSDDSVKVMITADCGQTWQTLRGFGVANAPGKNKTEYAVSLSAYANQEVRIAFFATEGSSDDTEDYYFLLDDIQLKTLIANNVGVSKMISPLGNCGLGSQAQVKVQVRNYGTAAQTSFPVSYSINGTVVTETFNGNLASGDTAVYTFTTPAFVGVAKPYNFICWTGLSGDPVIANDSARYRLVRYGTPITPVNFTGYENTNIITDIAEGWNEASGATAANMGDSEWKSGGISANTTGRVTLVGDDKKAWLVSPPIKLSGAPVLFFKAAVRTPNNGTTLGTFGADDKVAVMVSTDCGATWTEAFALNGSTSPALGASLTSYTLDLATYANQEVKIGFYATDGTVAAPGCDVHLDDIELRNNLATDGGAVEFISPPAVVTPGTSYPVQIRYRNFGTSSISNFRIAAEIGGATFSTFLFNNVAANAQSTVTLPGSFIAPASGTVNGFAYTEVLGDQDMVNDTTYSVFTVQQPVSVKDAKSLNVKVYPNPSNGTFKIKLGDIVTANAVVRMFSLDGKQVHESSFHGIAGQEVLEVKTENLTQGLYMLQLEVAGQRLITKVSVK
jgi:hypothetical protein